MILEPIADRYIGIVIDALASMRNPGSTIFYGLVIIVSIIAGLKWYQDKGRSTTEETHRIKTIPHTDNPFVETNWGAMAGALCFLVGGMPFILGFKLFLFSLIGVSVLVVIFSKFRYDKTNWPAIIFTTALIIAAISISQQIKAKEPWTQRQDIWLSLMVIGLALGLLSLILKALWIRRAWKRVRARCLDHEIWEDYAEGPDSGKTWYFQLLCEFKLHGRTYQVTPSYWRTFATKAGVSSFLERKISPSGWCQLRINPKNPLQAEVGPNYDTIAMFFTANRWLQLISFACLVFVVGAVFHYYDLNDPSLGVRLYNVDYESCTIAGRHWLVTDRETHRQTRIQCPQVTLSALNINQFDTYHANIYQFLEN